jgi:ribosomal protein S27AE
MMQQRSSIACPGCGAVMNHHADKLVETAESPTRGFAGMVLEIHTCPECGKVEARQLA